MDLKQLQTFLVLSQIKNFTKTAHELHYAQSNITSQIQQLEKELGVQLFERLGKTITLTKEGETLLPYATQILSLSKEAKKHLSHKEPRKFTIAASESICISRLPSIITQFRQTHPEIELHLNLLDTPDFLPLLSDNTIDAVYTLDNVISHSSLQTILKHEEPIGVFAPNNHPLTSKKHVTTSDFNNEPLIVTKKECCYRQKFEHVLALENVKPHIVLETSSLQVIKEATLSGLGLCVLPDIVVEKELKENKLVKLNYKTSYDIYSQLICHKDKWQSPALKAFLEIVM